MSSWMPKKKNGFATHFLVQDPEGELASRR